MLTDFIASLVRSAPQRAALSLFLSLALGGLQGIGVLMLVPMLHYVGIPGTEEGTVGQIASLFFERLRIPPTLPAILVVFVSLVSFRALLARWDVLVTQQLRLTYARILRLRLHDSLARASWSYVGSMRQSDLVHLLNDEVTRCSNASAVVLRFMTIAATTLAYVAVALTLSPVMTLISVCAISAVGLPLRSRLAGARETGRDVQVARSDMHSLASEHMAGAREIRAYGAVRKTGSDFAKVIDRLEFAWMRFARNQANVSFLVSTGTAAVLSGMLLLGLEVFHAGVPELLILIFLFSRIVPMANQLQGLLLTLGHELSSHKAVEESIRLAEMEAECDESDQEARIQVEQCIELRRVTFAYRHRREPAVAEVSLTLPAQKTTVLIGPSGSGKSTLAQLLMGLLMPLDGDLRVDGRVLGSTVYPAWRKGIGFVPQDTFLANASIRSNLQLAMPGASDAVLWQALRWAGAEDFVRALPNGLATAVGDRGAYLSGGERQRIALARALVRDPKVLVLDEATNSLDGESERKIYRSIGSLRGRCTILVIAHKLPEIPKIDQLLRLNENCLESLDYSEYRTQNKGAGSSAS